MPLGRNDPCHCGSGRKYKKCHEAQDSKAARAPHLQLVKGAPEPVRRTLATNPPAEALAGRWELAVAPFPGTIGDDPHARPVLVMLVAGGFVVSLEMTNRPPEEPHALAALMANEVRRTIDATGVVPREVHLRQETLADALRAELRTPHQIAVRVHDSLPELDSALQSLLAHMFEGIGPLSLLRAHPETWSAWGLPTELVRELFSAAAGFYAAAPWTIAGNEPPIRISRGGEPEWSMVVMGAAGEEFGLACYASAEELEQLYSPENDKPEHAFTRTRSTILSFTFESRANISRRMRDEIKAARWSVHGPKAYPTLIVLNTPGGGISVADATRLRDALISIPRFVAQYPEAFAYDALPHDGIAWTDSESGLTCRLDPVSDVPLLFETIETLTVAGPTGAGATPGQMLAAEVRNDFNQVRVLVDRTLDGFHAWLQHPTSGKAVSATTADTHARKARLLIEHCLHGNQRPITAMTEYDLRYFLFDWYPRKVRVTEREARTFLTSLRRFFTYLEEQEQVVCPWAWPLLDDTDGFLDRWGSCPRGFHWDPDVFAWQQEETGELMARLLLPDDAPASGLQFGEYMGPSENQLHLELHNAWLQWRDEIIVSGTTAPAEVLAALRPRTEQWAATSQAALDGRTPAAVIATEQAAMAARLRRSDDKG